MSIPCHDPRHILIRIPNWLGDMVMASGFIQSIHEGFPKTELHLIVKEQLQTLADLYPGRHTIIPFSKKQWPGLKGSLQFARRYLHSIPYDYFFSLPDSFSSAWISYFSSAKVRIGYRNEFRGFLLTHSLKKPIDLHRVEEYRYLLGRLNPKQMRLQLADDQLSRNIGPDIPIAAVTLLDPHPHHPIDLSANRINIVININSQASSRCLSLAGWKRIIEELLRRFSDLSMLSEQPLSPDRNNLTHKSSINQLRNSLARNTSPPETEVSSQIVQDRTIHSFYRTNLIRIYLPGSPQERHHVQKLIASLADQTSIVDCSGQTDLIQLADLLRRVHLVITTDSGPAHLANAFHTPTIVLFGAGNEKNTAPFNRETLRVIKNDQVKCRPCVKNICPFQTNYCIESLSPKAIINTAMELLNLPLSL